MTNQDSETRLMRRVIQEALGPVKPTNCPLIEYCQYIDGNNQLNGVCRSGPESYLRCPHYE